MKNVQFASCVAAFILSAIGLFIFPCLSYSQKNAEDLIETLNDPGQDFFKRVEAAKGLGKFKEAQSVKALIKAFEEDKEVLVRKAAVESLGTIGDNQAIAPLVAALQKDKDWVIRESSARVLVVFGDAGIESVLIDALKTDDNPYVRAEAATSLGKLSDKKAIPYLKDALKDDALVPTLDENNQILEVRRVVVEAAAEALQKLGVKAEQKLLAFDWVEHVIQRLGDNKNRDKYDRARAAWMLGLSQDKRAIKPLLTALKEDELQVQRSAAKGLGALGDRRAFDLLVETMNTHPNRWLRNDAAKALGMLGDKRAESAIRNALYNERISVSAAEEALKSLE